MQCHGNAAKIAVHLLFKRGVDTLIYNNADENNDTATDGEHQCNFPEFNAPLSFY